MDEIKNIEIRAQRAVSIITGQTDDTVQSVDMTFISGFSGINYWNGIGLVHEIIEVTPESVDLSWINSGNAPFLQDHEPSKVIGNIVSGEIIERNGSYVGQCRGRLSPNDAHCVTLYKDIKDGYRTNISASYDILSYVALGTDDAGYPIMKATRIKIMEVSLVAIPFDPTVGTNRSVLANKTNTNKKVLNEMENETKITTDIEAISAKAAQDAVSAERSRVQSVMDYASAFDVPTSSARAFIADSTKTVNEFRDFVVAERAKAPAVKINSADAGKIGMTDKEARRFSVSKALLAHRSGNWKGAEFEKEAIEASEKSNAQAGRSAKNGGILLPAEVNAKRAMTKANTGLVQTTVDGSGMLDYLFANNVIAGLVGRSASGLVGDVQYPSVTGKASVTYIDPETGTATESNPTFGSVLIKPKYAVAKAIIPQTLLRQSALTLDGFIESHIGTALGDSLDYQCINGTGLTGLPKGILAYTAENGLNIIDSTDAGLTYKDIVRLITAIKKGNVGGNISIITNPDMEGYLSVTPVSSTLASTMIWQDGVDGVGRVKGRNAYVTTNVPANTIIAGDFSDSILGYWNSVEIKLDEISGADSGALVVRGYLAYDFALGRPQAFSVIKDAVIA